MKSEKKKQRIYFLVLDLRLKALLSIILFIVIALELANFLLFRKIYFRSKNTTLYFTILILLEKNTILLYMSTHDFRYHLDQMKRVSKLI